MNKKPYDYEEYLAYLQSDGWKLVVEKVRDRYQACVDCHGKMGCTILDVHHKTYRNLYGGIYSGEPDDCILLCRVCHGLRHGKSPMSQIDKNLAKWLGVQPNTYEA